MVVYNYLGWAYLSCNLIGVQKESDIVSITTTTSTSSPTVREPRSLKLPTFTLLATLTLQVSEGTW